MEVINLPSDLVFRRIVALMDIIEPKVPTKLLGLINSTKGCRCEDPRDRVYGIISLIPNRVRTALQKPNYRLPVDNVYKDFFLADLKIGNIFGLFGYPLACN
jgi:hypothetical protein